jgi:hypothetical protein
MGMRVSGSNSNWSIQNQSQSVNNWQQRQSGLQDVMKALQSGDLASAQTSFNSLNIDTSSMNSNSPMAKLSTALKGGDLASAQQAAQGLGHRHHRGQGGGVQQTSSAQAASDPAFMQLVAQSLATTLSQNRSTTNNSTDTSQTANAGVAPTSGSTTDASTALSAFMQNLMSSLSGQAPGTQSAAFDADGDGQSGAGLMQQMAATSASSGTSNTQSALSSLANVQGPPSPRFNGYMQAMGGQMQSNLSNLLQQLSSGSAVDNTSSVAGATSTTSNLQSSFNTFMGTLGGQANGATLTSFLQNLEQNLQYGSSSGNLINVSA